MSEFSKHQLQLRFNASTPVVDARPPLQNRRSCLGCMRLKWHAGDPGATKRPAVYEFPDSPTSDNLTPQETTNQDAPDMGADGAGLSCPGSSVVADADGKCRAVLPGEND